MQKTMPKPYHHNRLQYFVAQSVPVIGVIAARHWPFVQLRSCAKKATK